MSLEMKDLCKLLPAFKRKDLQQNTYQAASAHHTSLIPIFLHIHDIYSEGSINQLHG